MILFGAGIWLTYSLVILTFGSVNLRRLGSVTLSYVLIALRLRFLVAIFLSWFITLRTQRMISISLSRVLAVLIVLIFFLVAASCALAALVFVLHFYFFLGFRCIGLFFLDE